MNMKNIRLKNTTVTVLLLFATLNCTVLNQDVKEAKNLMTLGEYSKAIELFNKKIDENPSDSEAHFLVGECYLNQGNYDKAKTKFDDSIALKLELSNRVAKLYKDAGDKALNSKKENVALSLYQEAIFYQPNSKDIIVKELYDQGMRDFEIGEYQKADLRFNLASSLDKTLNHEFSDLFFNSGKNADEDLCLYFFKTSKQYSDKHNKEIGEFLLNIADIKDSEIEIQKWRNEASYFIELPPDYVELSIGSTPFRFKKGEKNKLWYRIPQDQRLTVSIYCYKNTYEILNRSLDGNIKIFRIWKGEKLPSNLTPDIKIKAMENIMGEIIIRKKFIDD